MLFCQDKRTLRFGFNLSLLQPPYAITCPLPVLVYSSSLSAMADFTPQEDRLIEERLADDIGYKKIAGALGRRLDKHVKDHIHELRERLRLPLGSDSSSAYSTSTVPLPQRQITSTDGKITIDIGLQIQAHKRKDDNESVALYEGRYQDKDVVVKVFCLL